MFNPYGNAYMPYQYAPQSPQGIAGVRFVNGMDEAKNCLVPIGTRALFMDSKEDVFYIKETDANGISSVTPYSFSKVESSSPQYVTKEQVEEILENWRKRYEPTTQPNAQLGATQQPTYGATGPNNTVSPNNQKNAFSSAGSSGEVHQGQFHFQEPV